VRILLDTHCLIRLLDDSALLTPTARRRIRQAQTVYFSTASTWQLGLKWRMDKINVQPRVIAATALSMGLHELPIKLEAVLIPSEL